MFVEALEHYKCDELTRAPCRLRPNFDDFDHFSIIKVTETFCGCGHPPSSAPCQRWHPLDHPWTCYRLKTSRSVTLTVTADTGGQSALLLLLLLPVSVAHRWSTIMLLCTDMMFLACSMFKDRLEGTIFGMWHWRVDESFSHFHHEKVVKNIKIWLQLAQWSCQLIFL